MEGASRLVFCNCPACTCCWRHIFPSEHLRLFTVNSSSSLHWVILGDLKASALNCLASTQVYMVMQIRKVNRVKDYCIGLTRLPTGKLLVFLFDELQRTLQGKGENSKVNLQDFQYLKVQTSCSAYITYPHIAHNVKRELFYSPF